jgi:hypothetical protein
MTLSKAFTALTDICLDRGYNFQIHSKGSSCCVSQDPKIVVLTLSPNRLMTTYKFAHEVGHIMTVPDFKAYFRAPRSLQVEYERVAWGWANGFMKQYSIPIPTKAKLLAHLCLRSHIGPIGFFKLPGAKEVIAHEQTPYKEGW